MSNTLGNRIREHVGEVGPASGRDLEGIAYQVDRLADLLHREMDNTQAAINSNLDLIKRLKEAQEALDVTLDRLESVHHYLDSAESFGDEPDANRIREILGA